MDFMTSPEGSPRSFQQVRFACHWFSVSVYLSVGLLVGFVITQFSCTY